MPRLPQLRTPGIRILAVLSLGGCQGDLGPESGIGPPATLEIRSGSGQTGTVGGPLALPVVARVTDAEDRPVPGVPITFAAPAGGGAFQPSSAATDEDGEAQAVWTLGPHAGPVRAIATVGGLPAATISATALAGAPARLGFSTVPRGAVAGIAFDPPVAVAVEDHYGNRVPGSSVDVSLTVNRGTLAGTAAVTAVDGIAVFPALRIDAAGSDYVLTAVAEGLASAETESFPVATGLPAGLLALAGDGQDAIAGSTVAIAPVVVVRDAGGNGVAGVNVTFSVIGGGGSVTPSTVTTAADGRASPAAWTLGSVAGGNALRATTAALPGASVEFHADAVPGPVDAARSTIVAEPASVLTDSISAIRVTARDAYGNPVAGAVVRLSASGQGNTLVQPPATGPDGAASGTFRSSSTGTRTITAEVGGVTLSQQATVAVQHPPVAEVVVTPGEAALLVGQTVAFTAGALDAAGDPVPGATITWSSSDPGVATVAAGTVTAVSPGSATVTATSEGRSGTVQVTVSYGEGTLTDLTYCTMDGVPVTMDVYVPAAAKPRPLPVAVHVHGGGWISGNKSEGSRFNEMKPLLLERGYLVVSLNYRLAPTHKYPAQIQDVKCAIRHLRARASRYALDPERIGAWGGSAGGQLVSLLGTADAGVGFDGVGGFQGQSSAVQAVIAISAITDFTHMAELLDDYRRVFRTWPDSTSAEMIQASPVTHVSPGDAPFFFIVADEDELVMPAQSERMHELLTEAGVPSSLLRVLHANHALQPTDAPIDPSSSVINSRMADFFDQYLR
ncbi:MAG TPA: Ig-like domain-containing protein [Gemmatimonadales bacterium]|nr:Ig-like domain-containing protein [Gemmatimonadales bacterium]